MKISIYSYLFFLISCSANLCFAQTTYRIYLKDKIGTEYDPYNYLHPKAIERRIVHGLDLCESSDFPLQENYLLEISQLADSMNGTSRWLNAVFVNASAQNIDLIRAMPFVRSIEKAVPVTGNIACENSNPGPVSEYFDTSLTHKQQALLNAQLLRMGGTILRDSNLDGKGVRIAILDVGFKTYSTNPAFDHIRKRNGIIATYDFVKKRTDTNSGMAHGTNVFSCVSGIIGNHQIGLATGADFLLARTGNIAEFYNEEENWLMAAEWADKNGADIINSSLGYTTQRYLPENMDGKTAFVSRAAQIAVDKGILVVSAAGNEGLGPWKRVAAPGDASGVLTVGGIDPTTGLHIGFSSYGPSWDRRLKPELSAYGKVVASGRNGLEITDGTSFSSPLVAGFAACLKQRYPTFTNTQLKELICRSGDLWPYYDYAHGFGVPNPFFLFNDTLTNEPTLTIMEDSLEITLYPLTWDSAFVFDTLVSDSLAGTKMVISNETAFKKEINKVSTPPYLFYHIKNKKGYLDKYYVMDLKDEENGSVTISKDITEKPFSIEFFYKGYFKELIISE